jgi:DNA (cytosine-5)-methyltransferase 1
VSHPTDRSSGLKYASVCDGIGAAHVAWQPLGWQCQWTSEIEPFPAAVVEHHYGFRNLGDMTAITEEMLDAPVDLLVGGTPCQSFSVAGLRGGLADPRGNLALRFVQLAAVMQPRWIVWENVPGVLSSGKGRDFGTFLGALGELGYGFAYRVLDAQWFGVAQRRRRVFVVGYLGDWRRAAAVLFERESVFGNPPTRGATGEGSAIASSIRTKTGRTKTGRSDHRGDGCDNLVAFHHNAQAAQLPHAGRDTSVTDSLTCSQGAAVAFTKSKRAQSTTDDETWVPGEVSPTMSCFDQGDTRATTVVAIQDCGGREKQQNGKGWSDEGTAYTLDAAATQGVAQGFTYSGYSNQPASMTGDRSDAVNVAVPMVNMQGSKSNAVAQDDGPSYTLNSMHGHDVHAIESSMAVRRLTPRECERLQGFPDDYTLVTYRNKLAADGPRYRALGNSMAVPVMRWIGERIAMVDKLE